MVEELSGEMAAAFVVGGAGDEFEGDAAFGGQFGYYRVADCVSGCGGVADFLGGPVHVDFVGWEAEVV